MYYNKSAASTITMSQRFAESEDAVKFLMDTVANLQKDGYKIRNMQIREEYDYGCDPSDEYSEKFLGYTASVQGYKEETKEATIKTVTL